MVMKMEEGLDTGPVAMAERVPIAPDMTAGDLHDELARLGADLMVRALGALERGTLTLTPQPTDGVTYATKIDKDGDPHRLVAARRRRCTTTSAAFRRFPARGSSLRSTASRCASRCCARRVAAARRRPARLLDDALTVACGDGAVRILELQRAGRQAMKAEEFLRGSRCRVERG